MHQHTHTQIEEWRDIPGWEGYYQVSDRGNIRSVDRKVWRSGHEMILRGRPIRQARNSKRSTHLAVSFYREAKYHKKFVHRAVLEAFVGPCPTGMECCHNDGDPTNNRLSNLRWDTISENEYDQVRMGTHAHASKTHCKRGHEFTPENTRVENRGYSTSRVCRACHRLRSHKRRKAA